MHIPIIANNPIELVWLHIKQLTSEQVSKNLINEKFSQLGKMCDPQLLEKKAIGLSSSIKNALGFWGEKPVSLNSWILSRYYSLLQLTLAEQVSSALNDSDLSSIQKHTEQGHGLAIWHGEIENPLDFIIYTLNSGHFYSYSKFLGFNPQNWSNQKRAKNKIESQDLTYVTIRELLKHIAELEPVLYSFIQEPSKCLHIGHSNENFTYTQKLKDEKMKISGVYTSFLNIEVAPEFTYVNVTEFDYNPINLDIILESKIPLKEIEFNKDESDKHEAINIYTGKLFHESKVWWDGIKHYKSEYIGTIFISPLFDEINDPIIRHFFLLYGLSIIVRYMPDVWQEITLGKQNHIGALIEYYLTTIENVIPLLMLKRITGKNIYTALPGTGNSLV